MRTIALAASAVLLVGCSNSSASSAGSTDEEKAPTTFTVQGQLAMPHYGSKVGNHCQIFEAGYEDIAEGTQVTIFDSTGEAIALGQLKRGVKIDTFQCAFPFKVTDVPLQKSGSKVYSVEVSHRGKIQFSQADAEDVTLTLGS